MNKFHVVFISTPGNIGNLVPTVEFARHLTNHDSRFFATMFMIDISERPIVNAYIQSCAATATNLNFINLPPVEPPSPEQYQTSLGYICLLIAKHKLHLKNAIAHLMSTDTRPISTTTSDSDSSTMTVRIAGLFVDMFCTSMIDVANELGIPCYLYFASPVSFLGFMLSFPTLDAKFDTEFVDSESGLMIPKDPAATSELIIPGFANPLPLLVLPNRVLYRKQEGYFWFLHHARRYKETKGIVVNTFRELEAYAIDSVFNGIAECPPIYTIGPVLDHVGPAQWHPERAQHDSIMEWLDDKPPSSVVFLCFGSMGNLSRAQLMKIAVGLEQSGLRFLWSIREPPKGKLDLPGEYTNVEEILPQGFVDRSRRAGIGLVCGWVPQAVILGHQAVGGFVSHCGWNSILESVWYGVPIATWPLYAEQQMNAFQLVKELELAVEIRLDYREGSDLVSPEELERALRCLMNGDDENEVRRKVKEMKQKSRTALFRNGSSYKSLASLILELTAEI
ncbi:hypothetical protein CRYUN_Cryun18bG0143900 [Craigia yunnanensis]